MRESLTFWEEIAAFTAGDDGTTLKTACRKLCIAMLNMLIGVGETLCQSKLTIALGKGRREGCH